MHLLTIPPGGRAKVHKHESHETAIYLMSGEAHVWFGERLEQHVVQHAGEMFYIPAGVPHLPMNLGDEPAIGRHRAHRPARAGECRAPAGARSAGAEASGVGRRKGRLDTPQSVKA